MQPGRAQHVKHLERKAQSVEAHSAWVAQYTTLNYVAQVAKCIDDLHYENFYVPVLLHQERVRRFSDVNENRAVGHVYSESDYLDAQAVHTYSTPNFPLRNLASADELQRLSAANHAFHLALNGKVIPLSLLKRALTPEQFQEFECSLDEDVELSEIEYGDGLPDQLRTYNKKLSKADMLWGRFERLAERHGAAKAARAVEDRAVSLYEDALLHLEEVFDCAKRGDWGAEMLPRLQRWMDRPIDFDAGVNRTLNINLHEMPRVRGSKSRYAMDSGLPKLSKKLKRQYCALRSLLVAACEVAFNVPEQKSDELTAEETNLLRNKLKFLRAGM